MMIAGHNLLRAKAEVVLGVQLVTRHRAPRLVVLLSLAIAGLVATSSPAPDRVAHLVLLAAGTFGAVAASRVLSPGPVLAAARMVVAPRWIVPAGRLGGVLCVVGPFVLGLELALATASPQFAPVMGPALVALAYAACVGACTMALTPLCGASAGASLGFLAAWLGMAPPSAAAVWVAAWPPLQRVVIWLWNVLPLPWRAARWLASGAPGDPLVLVGWTLISLGVAATYLGGRHRPRRAQA